MTAFKWTEHGSPSNRRFGLGTRYRSPRPSKAADFQTLLISHFDGRRSMLREHRGGWFVRSHRSKVPTWSRPDDLLPLSLSAGRCARGRRRAFATGDMPRRGCI